MLAIIIFEMLAIIIFEMLAIIISKQYEQLEPGPRLYVLTSRAEYQRTFPRKEPNMSGFTHIAVPLPPPVPMPQERRHVAGENRGSPCKHFFAGFCKFGRSCSWSHHAKSGNALSEGPAARDGGPPCAPRRAPSFPAAHATRAHRSPREPTST